ncbi:MAG TPA: hypothetical protein VMI52_04770 [Acetobacteraceae bacterium]|nr:hypothetical protein [Acetobacteraceae bacterium]
MSDTRPLTTPAVPVGALVRRLLRRASEPVGVVDVRHATTLHARASLPTLQRAAFVDALSSRYGQRRTAAAGGSGPELPFLARVERGLLEGASAAPIRGAPVFPVGATIPAITAADAAATTTIFRVRRPGGNPEIDHSAVRGSEARVTTLTMEAEVEAAPRDRGDAPATSRQPEAAASAPMQPQHASRSVPPLPAAANIVTGNGASTVDGRLLPASISAAPAEGGPAGSGAPTTVTLGLASAEPEGTAAVVTLEVAQVAAARGPALTTLDLARRHADPAPAVPTAGLAQEAIVVVNGVQPPPARVSTLVAAEIRETRAAPTLVGLVWREASRNSAGPQTVARAAAAAAPVPVHATAMPGQLAAEGIPEPGAITAITATSSDASGADLTRVAEQVSRLIARQLRIERERRGGAP